MEKKKITSILLIATYILVALVYYNQTPNTVKNNVQAKQAIQKENSKNIALVSLK